MPSDPNPLARLWFYEVETERRIGIDVLTSHIAPVGALVSIPGDPGIYRVETMHFLYGDPASRAAQNGEPTPIVQVMVTPAEQGLFRA